MVDRNVLVGFLSKKMPLKLLILFGSVAKADDNAASDVDLAFIAKPEISNLKRWEIAEELAVQIGKNVDLVDLLKTNDVFRFQIISQGEILLCDGNFDDFLDRAYTTYLQLNEDRKEILQYYAG